MIYGGERGRRRVSDLRAFSQDSRFGIVLRTGFGVFSKNC